MVNEAAYQADMMQVKATFTRAEKDSWGVALTINSWAKKGVELARIGADSGMGRTNANRYNLAWEYFGQQRIDGESFTGHAYLAVASEEKAIKLLVEAQLRNKPVATLHRQMTNAVLDAAAEEHSDSPEALVAAEHVATKLAENPRLAQAAKAYAAKVSQESEDRAARAAAARNASAPARAAVGSSGTIFLARMLTEAAASVKLVNANDGFISDFDQLAEAARALGEELHVYAAKRGLDTSLAQLLGTVTG